MAVTLHVGFQKDEITALGFLLDDREVLEGDRRVPPVMEREEGTGNMVQILSDLGKGGDEAEARADHQAAIADPVLASVRAVLVPVDDPGPDRGDEEGDRAGDILPQIGKNPVFDRVVHHRGGD